LPRNEPAARGVTPPSGGHLPIDGDVDGGLALRWSARLTLTRRILAVNIFALAMLAGGFFYLDSYRARLVEERLSQAASEARMLAEALSAVPPERRLSLAAAIGAPMQTRVRVYDPAGAVVLDSWRGAAERYGLRDPDAEPWQKDAARTLDSGIDWVVDAEKPERFAEPPQDRLAAWPEALESRETGDAVTRLRRAPDQTPVISAAVPIAGGGTLLTVVNQRDITRIVRAERTRTAIVIGVTVLVSILLSLFLARTIVRPLRRLARAAQRVRLGRAREVVVPRLPSRRDEIGLLARAVSDMTQALRQRIDSIEAFAADVTHELKNPLASLRSAVDTLAMVKDPALQAQLLDVIGDDVRRLDRLITDIAEASRVDAELARARFEPIDLGVLIAGLIAAQEARNGDSGIRLAFARPHLGTATVNGDESRLMRAFDNLIDNAMSFSEPGGLVQIGATRDGDQVIVHVQDEGPGVRAEQREAIFRRFHSERPDGEAFGKHSGLGLAIAKAIVEGHDGSISVRDRDDAQSGARFEIRLPVATV